MSEAATPAWKALPFKARWEFVTRYDYLTPDGRTAFAHVRWRSRHPGGIDPVEDRPKCFTYWTMGPHPRPCECHGDWCDANWRRGKLSVADEWRRLPFKLNWIREWATRPGDPAPLFICEGEKDALALHGLGVRATSAHGGALHGWQEPETAWLKEVGWRGPNVVVVDNDSDGYIHAMNAINALTEAGVGVSRVVRAREGKDPADAVAAGLGQQDWAVDLDRQEVMLFGQAALERKKATSGGGSRYGAKRAEMQRLIEEGDW